MDHCIQEAPCPNPNTLLCWPWGCEDDWVGARAAAQGLATSLFLGGERGGWFLLVLISIAVALLRSLSRLTSTGPQSWLSLAQVIPILASPLWWMQQQCWKSSALYLFLSILDVARSNVKCAIKFVPPHQKKKKILSENENCLESAVKTAMLQCHFCNYRDLGCMSDETFTYMRNKKKVF